jgi:hypothetical protein
MTKGIRTTVAALSVAFLVVALLYGLHLDLPAKRASLYAAWGAWGVYLIIAYVYGFRMWYGAVSSPPTQQDTSEDNRVGRGFGLVVALFLYCSSILMLVGALSF